MHQYNSPNSLGTLVQPLKVVCGYFMDKMAVWVRQCVSPNCLVALVHPVKTVCGCCMDEVGVRVHQYISSGLLLRSSVSKLYVGVVWMKWMCVCISTSALACCSGPVSQNCMWVLCG